MRGEERIEIDLESVAASSSRQRGAFAESGFVRVRVRSHSNRAALSCDAPFRWPLVVRGIGSRNLVTNKLFFFQILENSRVPMDRARPKDSLDVTTSSYKLPG